MKSGIDYFPLDVALDEKFELIEAEFGLTGFGVVVKLLQKIYGGQGYYVEWTNEVALLFAKRVGLGGSVVSEIVEASVKRGIFDKTLYDKYHILTSKGIQKRYFEAVGRRKSVEVEGAYLLVNVADFSKNASIAVKNVDIFSKNADISQQTKVAESRVEKSRGKESRVEKNAREQTPYARFLDRWGISDKNLSNYNAGKVSGIDWDKMSEEVERSKFLQDAVTRGITFFINQSGRIMDGEFRDRPKRHQETDAAKVYTTLREKYKREEELNYASHKDVPS